MISCGLVSWASKLQNNDALSTADAEYMAFSAFSQEVMFLRQLLPTFGCPITGPAITYEDNDSCIFLAKKSMTTSKSKQAHRHL